MSLTKFINKLPSLENKIVIITGANSGVGFECSKHILSKNGHLVMACRNIKRAEAAKEELLKIYPNGEVDILLYDQSSLESVKGLVKEIIYKYPNFWAILLNAGIYHPSNNNLSPDGLPLTIATNFISNYVFLKEIKDYLNKSNIERRIVIQGSLAGRLKTKEASLIGPFKSKFQEYCVSKNALKNAFYETYNSNENNCIKYVLVEPGITSTNIVRGFPKWFQAIAKVFLSIFAMSAKKASLCALNGILKEDVNNGDMFIPRGLASIGGYPKLKRMKNKQFKDKYIKEVKEILND